MGSQTALELASRGRRVLGLDRYRPPHTLGSTHGRTRIIREAYFEEPLYVPIVQRAYELWRRLEERSGAHVLTVTGGLMLGAPDSEVVAGARASAVEHGLPYEELSAREVRERFPAYAVPDEHVAVFEPRAGFLEPEAAVEATLALAAEAGADLRFDEPVLELDGDVLRTERGTYTADRIVVSAGPWLPDSPARRSPPRSRRPDNRCSGSRRGSRSSSARTASRSSSGSGSPAGRSTGSRTSATASRSRCTTTASRRPRTRSSAGSAPRTRRRSATSSARFFPAGDGALREAAVCLYTNTPDEHFVIDHLPEDERVIVASPCSGHGFKFAPAIGEVLADLATGEQPRFDLTPFSLRRFAAV